MSDMLETWVMLHLRLHHRPGSALLLLHVVLAIVILVVIATVLVGEICWTFALMWSAILLWKADQHTNVRSTSSSPEVKMLTY
jgi:uncharacterized protein YqhQ